MNPYLWIKSVLVAIAIVAAFSLFFSRVKRLFSLMHGVKGNVAFKLQKDPEGIFCILSSLGGKLATLKLTPTKSIKIGQVLLTANDYYKKHQDFYKQEKEKYTIAYNEEHYDKVDVDGHKVIFHSQPKGTPFEVRVSEDKTFAVVAVILDRDQAVKIGKYMVDSEELASIVQAHVKP